MNHRIAPKLDEQPRADMCLTGWQYCNNGMPRREHGYEDNMYESDWRGHSLDAPSRVPAGCMVRYGLGNIGTALQEQAWRGYWEDKAMRDWRG